MFWKRRLSQTSPPLFTDIPVEPEFRTDASTSAGEGMPKSSTPPDEGPPKRPSLLRRFSNRRSKISTTSRRSSLPPAIESPPLSPPPPSPNIFTAPLKPPYIVPRPSSSLPSPDMLLLLDDAFKNEVIMIKNPNKGMEHSKMEVECIIM